MCDTGMGVVASIISCLLLITIYILDLKELKIQSGASSQAKNTGAFFSAVKKSIKDPIPTPGHCLSFMSYRSFSFFDYLVFSFQSVFRGPTEKFDK